MRAPKLFFLFFVSLLIFSCEKEADPTAEDLWGAEGENGKPRQLPTMIIRSK